MLGADVPPEVKNDLVVRLELDRLAQREEDGKPGEHSGGVGGRQDGNHNLFVEVALKVSTETMKYRVRTNVE